MSIGRPVVATKVGGVEDWLIDGVNGYLVEPHQPAQLASKILLLLENPKQTTTMAQAAQNSAQAFSIESMTANIEKIIVKTIQSS